jgi:hypothetical protein
VHAADPADARAACAGAGDALSFLGAAGLDIDVPIEIHVVERLPDGVEPGAAACYVHPQRRIYTRAPAGSSSRPPAGAFRYPSLVAHEVAHAVAACNFAVARPTLQAHEYIAAVTTIATLPEAERARLLRTYPGQGFDRPEQISATLYLLAPTWFAVEAYRHYRKPGNGPAFLHRVLSGAALSQPDER